MSIESEFNEYVELVESLEELRDGMTSPADIQHGISAIAMTLELVKKANKLIKDGNGLEAREIILSLQEQILDTKALLIETKGKVIELEEKNLELRDRLRVKEDLPELIQKGKLWYLRDDENPKCINCYRNKKEIYDLSTFQTPISNYKCPSCDALIK
jgi:hypothetical protein